MTITFRPLNTALALGAVAASLAVIHVCMIILQYGLGHQRLLGLIPFFHMDMEANFPTYFSSITMLFCAFLSRLIYLGTKTSKEINHWPWLMLAFCFLFVSLDEFVAIHEFIASNIYIIRNTKNVLLFIWIVPYGFLVISGVLLLRRFIIELPKDIRFWMCIAGILYLSGAMGFEIIGFYYARFVGFQKDVIYELIVLVEESLEMAGIIVLLFALMTYIDRYLPNIFFRVSSKELLVERPAIEEAAIATH